MNAAQATYAARNAVPADPVMLGTLGPNSLGPFHHSSRDAAAASNAKAATNRIDYHPFWLNAPYLVQRVWWLNGATVGTDNAQVGVYTEDFSQLFECTSTLTASANNVQFVTLGSPFQLPRMRGWLAHWCAGTTATFFGYASGSRSRWQRYFEQNAGGLPATGTPAAESASGIVFQFGITRRASP